MNKCDYRSKVKNIKGDTKEYFCGHKDTEFENCDEDNCPIDPDNRLQVNSCPDCSNHQEIFEEIEEEFFETPICYTINEGGEWYNWGAGTVNMKDLKSGLLTSNIFINDRFVHTFKFADGRQWDCVNGWRDYDHGRMFKDQIESELPTHSKTFIEIPTFELKDLVGKVVHITRMGFDPLIVLVAYEEDTNTYYILKDSV